MINTIDKITESIISKLEQGQIPWDKPFLTGTPCNYVTLKPYRGINSLLTAWSDYTNPYWLTFNQCRSLGGKIKAGSKGLPIVFYKPTNTYKSKTQTDINGKPLELQGMIMQYFTIFNYEQTEGLENKYIKNIDINPIVECETIVSNMPLKPVIGEGSQPCYIPSLDTVKIGKPETFKSMAHYYATLFHELAHSTGHEKRLNRQASDKGRVFGSEDYTKEELIAEFTAAFLCGNSGIERATERNTVAYIQSWLKAIKNDKKILLQASSAAQKAYDFITNQTLDRVTIA